MPKMKLIYPLTNFNTKLLNYNKKRTFMEIYFYILNLLMTTDIN